MKYNNVTEAVFIRRLNRFVAEVSLDGETIQVHVKNTGRLRELFVPGARVALADSGNPRRKYRYDLVSVYKGAWVNVDSQASNTVMHEWLKGRPEPFRDVEVIKPEYVFGNSRVDFYMRRGDTEILLEVKGCTLERDGIGYFPDAPTDRGVKHLSELAKAARSGYECYIAFVIAIPGVTAVLPNVATHPEFACALDAARAAGVKTLYLPCRVSADEITIDI